MEQKQCRKCNLFKFISDFSKRSNSKDGLYCYCKACNKQYYRKYYVAHKEKYYAKAKNYCLNNKDKIKAYKKIYAEENRKKLNAVSKDRRLRIKNDPKLYQNELKRRREKRIQNEANPEWCKRREERKAKRAADAGVTAKICSVCKIEKPFSEFPKDIRYEFGYNSRCKLCRNEAKKQHFLKNEDVIKEKNRLYRLKNKNVINAKAAIYRNTDEYRKRINNWTLNKRHTDPMFRMSQNMSSLMRHSLNNRSKAGQRWEDILGYTVSDLKNHLESRFKPGMTWENYGGRKNGWAIDHIKPRTLFNFTTPQDEEFKKCWALENLQPLWWSENCSKGDKYNG